MKILFLIFALLFPIFAYASDNCFLVKSGNHAIVGHPSVCQSRSSPASTFKIAISLMGYDDGFLIDESHPELPFKPGYANLMESWRHPHNPTSWMKNSVVWYSQVITYNLGAAKFQEYVKKFNYGNQDVSGDAGKNNGLTRSWLSSSLQISPDEQITFLQKLINNELPVSPKAHEMTKNIMFLETLPDGWKLYGKTGSGDLFNADGSLSDKQLGWFVGWVQKENRIPLVFANYIEDENSRDYSSGKKAKEEALKQLIELIKPVSIN